MRRQRGLTLIELVASISVIAIAGAALVSTLAYLSGTGNNSMIQAQAQSIAAAYLNEITGKSFNDPAPPNGETQRDQFDDVNDYNGLDATATDEFGNPAGNFRVRVTVTNGGLGALPAADVRRVDVTVSYGNGASVVATGYRTRYP